MDVELEVPRGFVSVDAPEETTVIVRDGKELIDVPNTAELPKSEFVVFGEFKVDVADVANKFVGVDFDVSDGDFALAPKTFPGEARVP